MKRSRAVHSIRVARLLALAVLAACGDDGASGTTPSAEVTEQSPDEPMMSSPPKSDDDAGACDASSACDGSQPPAHSCGDGVRDSGEQCDDGNHNAGDGCGPNCKSESGTCGNGKVDDKNEECDDGNTVDDDTCSNACLKNECGNKRVDVTEECDDGNKVDADKCSNQCLWVRCRNGRLDPGEECDDGNDRDDDGCSNRCKVMICGNSKKEDKEECDDGNMVDNDACSNKCTENKCGNGRKDPGEDCDGDLECDDKCKKKPDLCRACEEKNCRTDYPQAGVGIDWYKGCVLGMPPYVDTADPNKQPIGQTNRAYAPAEFIQKCMGVVNCVRKTMCLTAEDLGQVANHCYCGTADLNTCFMSGPLGGACDDEIVTAAEVEKTDYTNLSVRISDFLYPAGWATYLIQCDHDLCSNECMPWAPVKCGNGVQEMGEDCDDGNMVDTDACPNTCKLTMK